MSLKSMVPPIGVSPFETRANLLNHRFSPVISLEASETIQQIIQQQHNTTILDLFKLYGDNHKYPIPNQQFKIITNQLITKSYPSFPLRFVDTLTGDSTSIPDMETELYKQCQEGVGQELYGQMFNHMVSDKLLLSFETFNHPISQVFVVNIHDSIDELRNMIVLFRNQNYPMYFQMNDLLFHVVIFYEQHEDVVGFQNEIKTKLNLNSTVIQLDTSLDIRYKLNEYIVKHLIPHIQLKIRLWDDLYLQPKKSITNRFISVSKRFFNNNSTSDSQLASSTSTTSTTNPFNYNENYYYKGSNQQIIRKLADWALMLNDFKYAYTIYDLIKKDFSQDKAWIYVASTQEMCIISLLLAQTDTASVIPDKNTLRKIRHDIIEPFMDNLTYTYKSRFNYIQLNRRCLIIVVELLLCMTELYNLAYWWIDLIELYTTQLIEEIDHESKQHSIIKALFYERLGYSFGHYYGGDLPEQAEPTEEKEEEDVNPDKLLPPIHNSIIGLTRFRKSSLWYLLSVREWLGILDRSKLSFIIENIRVRYTLHDSVIKEILTDNLTE
ncbi:Trafficking protein particle complex III-specific subunit 85 [Spathaspora sp. JA1]|nr:Trafficking protein particle complex III-specific subunit 85 [Spathaspora sp. JA1]